MLTATTVYNVFIALSTEEQKAFMQMAAPAIAANQKNKKGNSVSKEEAIQYLLDHVFKSKANKNEKPKPTTRLARTICPSIHPTR